MLPLAMHYYVSAAISWAGRNMISTELIVDADLMFTTIPTVFQQTYGWSPQLTGLAYLGREFSSELTMVGKC